MLFLLFRRQNILLTFPLHFYSERDIKIINLNRLQEFIDTGRLKPKANDFITIRDLALAGLVTHVGDGVKLLAEVSSR